MSDTTNSKASDISRLIFRYWSSRQYLNTTNLEASRTMLDFKNLKTSDILQAMVTGLRKAKTDPKFIVEMETLGRVQGQLCYGCAATLALTEMFGGGRSASEMMLGYAKPLVNDSGITNALLSDVIYLDLSSTQGFLTTEKFKDIEFHLEHLEYSAEYAQSGLVSSLIEFSTGKDNKSFDGQWKLNDHDWEEQLPKIEATIVEMVAAGY